jgi:hypothetical protein
MLKNRRIAEKGSEQLISFLSYAGLRMIGKRLIEDIKCKKNYNH